MYLDEARRVRSFSRVRLTRAEERRIPEHQIEHLVERSSGESVLPGVRRLNESQRNAGGVLLPLARRGQSAERAGATPLFGAFGSPVGGPGAGVAPARGTLEQPQIARNNCA